MEVIRLAECDWMFSYESIVKESPIGPMEMRVMTLFVGPRKLQQIEGNQFLDVSNGDVVEVLFPVS